MQFFQYSPRIAVLPIKHFPYLQGILWFEARIWMDRKSFSEDIMKTQYQSQAQGFFTDKCMWTYYKMTGSNIQCQCSYRICTFTRNVYDEGLMRILAICNLSLSHKWDSIHKPINRQEIWPLLIIRVKPKMHKQMFPGFRFSAITQLNSAVILKGWVITTLPLLLFFL